ncbi:hypothetical protein AB6E26_06830, partial [Vibrio splendidus]
MDMTTLNLGGALALGQRIVISVDGTIKVLEEGQPLQAGDVVLESQNGSNEPQVSTKRFSSEEGEIELDQDIANIFAALEEGQDPTELGEEFATAAGQNGSSLASSGTIERDGEETIPGTEFVTTGFESLGLSRTQSLSLLDAFRFATQTTITDEATPGTEDTVSVTLSGPDSIVEGETSSDYTVTLSDAAPAGTVITLSYSYTTASGDDIVETTQAVVGADGKTATFAIATEDDKLAEGSEAFTVSVSDVQTPSGDAVFEKLNLDNASKQTTITDEATPGTEDTVSV